MIDLNDVLLAMSNIPVDDPIAEIWGRGLQCGYKIIEYTGSLPITINANGDALIDYRIYGADGGVGEPTENLFDKNDTVKYYALNINTGNPIRFEYGEYVLSDYIPIAFSTVTISAKVIAISGSGAHWATYDENKTFISGGVAFSAGSFAKRTKVVDTSGAAFIRVDYALEFLTDCMLNLGSTAPAEYIPYGYKLPILIFDGNTAQSVPVYIGETQLEEYEYVSFSEQKIYRDVNGTLTPSDPPIPLPNIPTIKGETVIDYDGEPKPSQVYIKYKGKE